MLPNNRHLSLTLNGTKYYFDVDLSLTSSFLRAEPAHQYPSLDATRSDLPGSPQDRNLRQSILFWKQTDWKSGEGGEEFNKSFWSPDDPFAYDNGTGNGRIPGRFKGPPNRDDSNIVIGTVGAFQGPILVSSHGYEWALGARSAKYTTNGTTWSSFNIAGAMGPGVEISSACGGTDYVYVYATDTPTGLGTSEVWAIQVGAPALQVFATSGGNSRNNVLAIQDQWLFAWTGQRLRQADVTNIPAGGYGTLDPIDSIGPDPGPPAGATYGICRTDASVVYFVGNTGHGVYREYRDSVAAPFWDGIEGFTPRAIAFALGMVYVVGDFGGNTELYQMPLDGSFPARVAARIRPSTSITAVAMSAGPGGQVLIHTDSGVFIYDAYTDGLSLLENRSLSGGTPTSVGNYTDRRMAAWYKSSTSTWEFSAWEADTADTTRSGYYISEAWDQGVPQEVKVVDSVDLTFDPMIASEAIDVQVQTNESGSFTTVGSQITGNTEGVTNLRVSSSSSTVSSRNSRWKVSVNGGATLRNAVSVYRIIRYEETFDLYISLQDGNDSEHPDDVTSILADLRAVILSGDIVSMEIGWEDPSPEDSPLTVDVVLEDPESRITSIVPGERSQGNIAGWCHLRARNVARSTTA